MRQGTEAAAVSQRSGAGLARLRERLRRLASAEIGAPSPRRRRHVTAFVALFTAGAALSTGLPPLDPSVDHFALARDFLVAGVVPDGPAPLRAVFARCFAPLLTLALCLRFAVFFLGFVWYERCLGRPFALQHALVFPLANALSFGALLASLALLGTAAGLTGSSFAAGWRLLESVEASSTAFVEARVPTLVAVPWPLPLLVADLALGLAGYVHHRLQHEWRPLWLFVHRAHHVTPQLLGVTTAPVDAFNGLFIGVVPRAAIFAVATKLFSSEPMLLESLCWALLSYTVFEAFNHTETFYAWTRRTPLRRFWFGLTGNGAYHLVHHSALPEHSLANLGGGFFLIWDRLFRTYHAPPELPPPMGLTGSPPLTMSPLRLAFASFLEVAQELRLNRRWRDRLLILFGPASYVPPVAVSYLIRSAPAAS